MLKHIVPHLGLPRRDPPPVPTPIPALELIAFGGLFAMPMPPHAYEPGDAAVARRGEGDVATRPVSGLMLRFPISDEHALKGIADDVTAAVTDRLNAVREAFKDHPLVAAWKHAAEELAALKARETELRLAPAKAEAALAAIVSAGKGDTTAAEVAYLEADKELRLFGPRLRGLTDAESRARAAALDELARLVDGERVRIHDEAAAEAQRIADEILAFARERVEKLLRVNRVAGLSHEDVRVADGWWRMDVRGTFAHTLPVEPVAPPREPSMYHPSFGIAPEALVGGRRA